MSDYHQTSTLHKAASTVQEAGKANEKVPGHDVLPTGVLAIHIKRCKNVKVLDGSKAFSKRLPVSLYFKMVVGDITKTTSVNDVRCSSNVGVVFDDLKHFLVSINNKLDDESNKIRFMLMGYQGNNKHKKLGEKEIHLFNIIRSMFIVETLEVARNAHVMGEVEVEMAFSYGCFGYGYSSQLESKTLTPAEQISQSLFLRAEPPFDRTHDTKDVMTAIPVPHPPFVNWPVQVDLAMSGNEFMTDSITELMSGKERTTSEYLQLKNHMKRLPGLQRHYSVLTKRSQRLAFLQSLVTTKISPELEENHDELLFKKDNSSTPNRSAEVLEHPHEENTYYDEDESPGLFSKIARFFGFMERKPSSQASAGNVEVGVPKLSATDDGGNKVKEK